MGVRKNVISKPPHLISRSPSPPPEKYTSRSTVSFYSKKSVAQHGSSDDSDPSTSTVDPMPPNLSDAHFYPLFTFTNALSFVVMWLLTSKD